MGVVDVESRTVGEDDVGHAGVFFGFDELRRHAAAEVEAAGVAQR